NRLHSPLISIASATNEAHSSLNVISSQPILIAFTLNDLPSSLSVIRRTSIVMPSPSNVTLFIAISHAHKTSAPTQPPNPLHCTKISHASAMSVTHTSKNAKRPASSSSKPRSSPLPLLILTSMPLTLLPSAKPMPSLQPTFNACAPIATHTVPTSPNSNTNTPSFYRRHSQRTKTSPLPPPSFAMNSLFSRLSSLHPTSTISANNSRLLRARLKTPLFTPPRFRPDSPLLGTPGTPHHDSHQMHNIP
ncbi:hypothetical protein SARC_14886, partial [Sphaeroforma arctica JP610]